MAVDIIIINLTRFGDLLQTQATIDALYNSGLSVGLVCLSNFQSATPLLRNLEQTWALPGAALLEGVEKNWHRASENVISFAREIRQDGKPKYVLNLTPSPPARLLTKLLASDGAQIYGFAIDDFGFGINNTLWTSFISVAAHKRGNSPFNISDMFQKLAAPLVKNQRGSNRLKSPDSNDQAWAQEFLARQSNSFAQKPDGFVVFQLGASETRRRWPVAHFKRVGDLLWEKARICPILTGSSNEAALGEEYAKLSGAPFINAIGATSLPHLGALLSQCRLLVTNDTGTMHLAAGLGTPSLSFFMATAQPWDTGPALPGCCCLEPALDCHPCVFNRACTNSESCRSHIDANLAAGLALNFLRDGYWSLPEADEKSESARIWVTSRDTDSFTTLLPLNKAAESGPGLWMRWQKTFWQNLLRHLDEETVDPSFSSEIYKALPIPDNAEKMAANLEQASRSLKTIAECGFSASQSSALAKVFLKSCDRLQNYLELWPRMSSVAAFWQEFRISHGSDLQIFCKQCLKIADHMTNLGAMLKR